MRSLARPSDKPVAVGQSGERIVVRDPFERFGQVHLFGDVVDQPVDFADAAVGQAVGKDEIVAVFGLCRAVRVYDGAVRRVDEERRHDVALQPLEQQSRPSGGCECDTQ
ncbi:hypothetical protein JCM10831_18940 [Hydrogenophilus hirschii]